MLLSRAPKIAKTGLVLAARAMLIGLIIAVISHLDSEDPLANLEWAEYCATEGQDDHECQEDQDWADYCASEEGQSNLQCYRGEVPQSVKDIRMWLDFFYHTAEFIIGSLAAFLAGVWSVVRPIKRT